MTTTERKRELRRQLRSIVVGDQVEICRVTVSGIVPLTQAHVSKVLRDTLRVEWSDRGDPTTDYSRDTGRGSAIRGG